MSNEKQSIGNGVNYQGARGMKTFVDANGYEWLCDRNVDPSGDFASQGCWRVDQMAFDRNF